MSAQRPGTVVLFGSGEASASGRRIWDWLLRRGPHAPRTAILETPAGFELNSDRVAGRIGDFLTTRLQNYEPQITIVPARRRGTPFSPDRAEVVTPLLSGDVIFLGPGSPTYAVRQLEDSLAWHMLQARHRLGAAVVLASAATIASSLHTLPVYEIYKAGADLHWCQGLDFFGAYGLSLVFIPHWNNRDGGEELDTSHCYMGRPRYRQLVAQLPAGATIVGIDEHSALAVDPAGGQCRVLGQGGVTVTRQGREQVFASGQAFDIDQLGPFRLPAPEAGIPRDVWRQAHQAQAAMASSANGPEPPAEVMQLVSRRTQARGRRDWAVADRLRAQIEAQGWTVQDTPEGPAVQALPQGARNEQP